MSDDNFRTFLVNYTFLNNFKFLCRIAKKAPLLLLQSAVEAHEKLMQRLAELILPPTDGADDLNDTPKLKRSSVQAKYNQHQDDTGDSKVRAMTHLTFALPLLISAH